MCKYKVIKDAVDWLGEQLDAQRRQMRPATVCPRCERDREVSLWVWQAGKPRSTRPTGISGGRT
jgi:hypothetical protein